VAQRRDHGRDVPVLKRAAPALVESKTAAPTLLGALLGALQWRGVLSLRAVCGSGAAAAAAASPPGRSRSPSAAMGHGAE